MLSIAERAPDREVAGPAPSLEYRSKLVHQEGEAYVRHYPTAGEATITTVPWWLQAGSNGKSERRAASSPRQCVANGRRAIGQVRRQVRANRLRYLWTLTYREAPESRSVVVRDLRDLARRFQRAFGKQPLVAVIERGSENGRLHVHLAVSRFLSHKRMERVWGQGWVWVGDDRRQHGKLPARSMARYLSKYLAKQIEDEGQCEQRERSDYGHRYFIAQGFGPLCFRRQHFDELSALRWLERHYGLPDEARAWADPELSGVHGLWLSYPDAVIARWLTTA